MSIIVGRLTGAVILATIAGVVAAGGLAAITLIVIKSIG